ncbi:sulfite exporter TauE/SafE family protein [Candidatus Enterococcus clewellii]|uniref:Probable membrane transporter protein n=1 Tax=Candidatus Enterococcus clewellii TaxID=1834193 RepID=A0A242KDZ8_9ENTE|nr:sulfite exporter TauE/SafE family protein [Enterococcus sp. 9E7_DIV0242]OTP19393.1 hypothetical protein A5888_001210 [Enterococcus sp. 9E7_DIV0242]
MTGILYFFVIIIANTIGAVSGMGGGVIIKPVLDFIHADTVVSISFYSSVAVFTMSFVSTWRQLKNGVQLDWRMLSWISLGAVMGGIGGNLTFDYFLQLFQEERGVQLVQIGVTIITLLFAFFYTKYNWKNYQLKHVGWQLMCGLLLGFLASLLGIGGGPINVSLLMLLFGLPIKEATVYSIGTIFFSQLSKLLTIAVTAGFAQYDLTMLLFVVPAAIIGGSLGAKVSHLLPSEKVKQVFQGVVLFVLFINLYNGWQLL